MDDAIMSMLSTVGVPAAVCFFVLTKMQTAIDNNTKAILALTARMGTKEERQRSAAAQEWKEVKHDGN